MGKVLNKTKGIPLDKGYDELQNLFSKLEAVQKVMLDPKICSIRIVVNPERMVIQEAKRAYTYLNLYGYNVDAVIVNRVLPDLAGVKGSIFEQYVKSQVKYLEDIEESFQPLPIFKVEHQGKEVFGLELLDKIGSAIYGAVNPQEIYHSENPFKVKEFDQYYRISLFLPFITDSEFELNKFGDELIVEINGRKKSVLLPRFANFLNLDGHTFKDSWLHIRLNKN